LIDEGNTIAKPENFGDGIRVRQVGEATSSNPKDDDVVDGPRRFNFVLDDSECEAAASQAPTYYQRKRTERAKPEKEAVDGHRTSG